MNKLLIGGVVLIIAVGGTFLFSQQKQTQPTSQEVTPTFKEQTSMESQEAVREIKISGNEYSFSPSSISVKKGEKVKITFENTGRLPHNVTIAELGFTTDTIAGGKATQAEFTADKSGTFTMYCSVGNHKALGMTGEVEVE